VFIVAAWVILQVADLALQSWGLPGQALRYVWIGAAVCFPLALVFGWRYDVTADGIRRTPPPHLGEAVDLSLKGVDYLLLVSLSVMIALVAVGLGTRILEEEAADPVHPPTGPADVRSIAVLPFVNMSATPENDFFSDGLTEETISLLADLGQLRVAARSSTFPYKGKIYSIPDVAKRLSVDVVLEGSVRRQQNQVRVTAQLVDARSESILWTDSYDRQLEDVIAIERDIAQHVTDALQVVLSSRSRARLQKPYTTNVAAFDSYLLGRNFLRKPKTDPTIKAAVERFQQAIDLDPEFAQAYAGLCEARLSQYELTRATSFFEKAESACLRALTRDSEATDTYLALANLHFFSGQHDQAEREFKHVLALNPTLVDARLGLARTYAAADRAAEAEAEFRRAIDEAPGYWDGYQLFGSFLFESGRYTEAAANYREAIRHSPDNANAYSNLGGAYYMAGDFESAARAYGESLQVLPSRAAYSNTGTMYYYSGDYVTAAQMYRKALEITPDDARLWGNLGDALNAGAGTSAEARGAYRQALALTESMLEVNPGDAEAMAEDAYFSAQLGDDRRATQMIAKAMEQDPDNMYTYYYGALIHQRQGRVEETYTALERALELGYQPALLKADPGFGDLAGEPRFAALLEEEHR